VVGGGVLATTWGSGESDEKVHTFYMSADGQFLLLNLGVEPAVADLPLDQFGPVQAQVTRPVRSLDLDVDALAGALLG